MAQPHPALVPTGGLQGVTLTMVKSAGKEEILELRNGGAAAVDELIARWQRDAELTTLDFCHDSAFRRR